MLAVVALPPPPQPGPSQVDTHSGLSRVQNEVHIPETETRPALPEQVPHPQAGPSTPAETCFQDLTSSTDRHTGIQTNSGILVKRNIKKPIDLEMDPKLKSKIMADEFCRIWCTTEHLYRHRQREI